MLEAGAAAFLRERLAAGGPHPAVRDLDVPERPDAALFDERRKALARRARGQTSPLACVDAVQAAWTIAWRKLGSLREPARLKQWLISVAANEARRLAKRRRRRVEVEVGIDVDAPSPDP